MSNHSTCFLEKNLKKLAKKSAEKIFFRKNEKFGKIMYKKFHRWKKNRRWKKKFTIFFPEINSDPKLNNC